MTVNELISALQHANPGGDATVIVECFGGLTCNTNPIVGVFQGFDWKMGRIVLKPQHEVCFMPKAK